jgi:CHASE2 domain-containing sensor protein
MERDESAPDERRVIDRLRDWFRARAREPFWQKVTIGVVILVLVKLPYVSGIVSHAQRALLDWQIAAINGTSSAAGIAFIDIDDATEARFAADGVIPNLTPRDELLKLINAAVTARAGIVVVDVDLSEAADEDAFTGRASRERPWSGKPFFDADRELAESLGRHARACNAGTERPCIPIVLVRELRIRPGQGASSRPVRVLQPSFIDPELVGSAGVVWSTALFDHDDDGMLRRWRLWEPACTPSGDPAVLPSAALVAAVFGRVPDAAKPAFDPRIVQRRLERELAPAACDRPNAVRAMPNEAHRTSIQGIDLTAETLPRQIRYRVSDTSMAQRISAFGLLTDPAVPLDNGCDSGIDAARKLYCVRGKIVVIGSTYRDDGDYHRVPAGELAGSLVIVNVIDSLLTQTHDFDELKEPLPTIIELGLIVGLAWLLTRFEEDEPLLLLAFTVAIVVLSLPISFIVLLEGNSWFDIGPPLIGIALHDWFGRGEHYWRHRGAHLFREFSRKRKEPTP